LQQFIKGLNDEYKSYNIITFRPHNDVASVTACLTLPVLVPGTPCHQMGAQLSLPIASGST